MSKKINRALYGPGWAEVILGAVLSMILGVILAVVYLVFRPPTLVKEMPKEPAANVVYYIEGSHDINKARRLPAKEKSLQAGQTVAFSEDELNVLSATPPPKPGAAAPEAKFVTLGDPNFRIHDSVVQVAVPAHLKYSLVALDTSVTLLLEGTLVKVGNTYTFSPETIYLGSCPIHRLPFAGGYVRRAIENNLLNSSSDSAAFWHRVTEATVDGSTVKITAAKT